MNIGTGLQTSVNELYQASRTSWTGRSRGLPRRGRRAGPHRPGRGQGRQGSEVEAAHLLQDGLSRTVDWYRQNLRSSLCPSPTFIPYPSGFDDGASNDDEFCMARAAVRNTSAWRQPHYDLEAGPGAGRGGGGSEERGDILRAEGIGLELVPGSRCASTPASTALPGGLGAGAAYLGRAQIPALRPPLIDMPSATGVLFQVQLCSIVPILVHPERNRYLAERTDAVRELRSAGWNTGERRQPAGAVREDRQGMARSSSG